MGTMIYLVEGVDHGTLTPKEREILDAIVDGMTLPSLAQALGVPTPTSAAKMRFCGRIQALVDKGFVRTETIGLAIAS